MNRKVTKYLALSSKSLGNVSNVYLFLQKLHEMTVMETELVGEARRHHGLGQPIGDVDPFGDVHDIHWGHLF